MFRMDTEEISGIAGIFGMLSAMMRTRFVILACIFGTLLVVAPNHSQAKPECPCWEDSAQNETIVTNATTWATGAIVACVTTTVKGHFGSVSTQLTDSGVNVRRWMSFKINNVCRISTVSAPILTIGNVPGGADAKCRRDVKNFCAALGF